METVKIQIMFDRVFGNAVFTFRIDGMIFFYRQVFRFAVNCAAGGNIDEFFDFILKRGFDEVDTADNITFCVEDGIFQRFAYINLRGVMIDIVRFFQFEDGVHNLLISDIRQIKHRFRIEIFIRAGGKIVDNDDFMIQIDKFID